jgi:hypothetical protein
LTSNKVLATDKFVERMESLLESAVNSQRICPPWAVRVRQIEELPQALQSKAQQAAAGSSWCAFADGDRVFFFTGEFAPELSLERRRPVLHVSRFDGAGQIVGAAHFAQVQGDTWARCL